MEETQMSAISWRIRATMLVMMLVVIAAIGMQTASATTVVGTCMTGTQFSSIQDAINNVVAGTNIHICPGTYPEQLHVNRALTLTGVVSGTSDAVIIVPPVGGLVANTTSLRDKSPIAAQVLVDVDNTVNLANIIVDSIGNSLNACAPLLVGIFYRNSSGTVNHVVTRNQWVGTSEQDPNLDGCQTGLGIFAQSGNNLTSAVTVENSSVHDYQKNGITGNEVGTIINVLNNNVIGQGATNGAAENGIQIGFGAAGMISGNTVIDDVWAPATVSNPGNAASGILLFDAGSNSITVKANTVGNTQFGIALATDTAGLNDGVTVQKNKVTGTRIFDAIDVCSNGNTVTSNVLANSAESAIHLDASCGALDGGTSGDNNTVTTNIVSDGNVGVLKDTGVTGNTTTPNTFFATATTDPAGNARSRLPFGPARP
jgi:hypothetical protein